MTGPIAVSGSVGSPTLTPPMASVIPFTRSSWTRDPAMTRQGAVQSWPEL